MNKSISKKEFMIQVSASNGLQLIQFKTEWNGACQIVSMIYEDLAKAYAGVVDFFSVDIELDPAFAKEYGVTEVPAILFFSDGKVVDHTLGLVPKNILISKIENALAGNKNQTNY